METSSMSSGSREPSVPYLTTDQMRQVDRAMVEDYGISLMQMMENAGRNLAHLARHRFLGGDPRGHHVLVLAGPGGNGGGGLVCGRRLHNGGPPGRNGYRRQPLNSPTPPMPRRFTKATKAWALTWALVTLLRSTP